jgi:hypothetical protein
MDGTARRWLKSVCSLFMCAGLYPRRKENQCFFFGEKLSTRFRNVFISRIMDRDELHKNANNKNNDNGRCIRKIRKYLMVCQPIVVVVCHLALPTAHPTLDEWNGFDKNLYREGVLRWSKWIYGVVGVVWNRRTSYTLDWEAFSR